MDEFSFVFLFRVSSVTPQRLWPTGFLCPAAVDYHCDPLHRLIAQFSPSINQADGPRDRGEGHLSQIFLMTQLFLSLLLGMLRAAAVTTHTTVRASK